MGIDKMSCTRKNGDFQMKNLTNVVLSSTHNICFRAKIRKSFNPVNLTFPNIKWDLQGVHSIDL